jgi:hypothetical protein
MDLKNRLSRWGLGPRSQQEQSLMRPGLERRPIAGPKFAKYRHCPKRFVSRWACCFWWLEFLC